MRRESDRIIGDFVRAEKDGDEHIHHCLTCGRNKLSVNQGLANPVKTGMYHCWHCGISGLTREGVTFPVFTVHRDQTVTNDAETYEKMFRVAHVETDIKSLAALLAKRQITGDVIEPFSLCFEPQRKEKDRLAMPMHLGARPCGYQLWCPSERIRYKNEGGRGIAGEEITGACTHVVLCEGMFDAFRIWEVIHDKWARNTRYVMSTSGSSISQPQIAELLGRIPETAEVYIAFDNDKLSAAMKAYNMLSPYLNIHVALPPAALGGDWDDIFKADAAWARKFWHMTLKGD